MQASMILNNKGGNLSDKQRVFAYDILSSFQMLEQLKRWQQEYKAGGASVELRSDSLQHPVLPPEPADTPN